MGDFEIGLLVLVLIGLASLIFYFKFLIKILRIEIVKLKKEIYEFINSTGRSNN